MRRSGSEARSAYDPQDLDEPLVPDDALAERARRGSGAAFATLVARYGDAVYTLARNMCATSGEVEAVLQQGFLAAWRDLRYFPAGARFATWLYGITMRMALTQRQRGRRSSCSLEPLREALQCMDDQACAVFVLHDLLELTVEEAAVILETSPRAVRRDVDRSRLMLRGFLDQL